MRVRKGEADRQFDAWFPHAVDKGLLLRRCNEKNKKKKRAERRQQERNKHTTTTNKKKGGGRGRQVVQAPVSVYSMYLDIWMGRRRLGDEDFDGLSLARARRRTLAAEKKNNVLATRMCAPGRLVYLVAYPRYHANPSPPKKKPANRASGLGIGE